MIELRGRGSVQGVFRLELEMPASERMVFHSGLTRWIERRLPLRSSSIPERAATDRSSGRPSGVLKAQTARIETWNHVKPGVAFRVESCSWPGSNAVGSGCPASMTLAIPAMAGGSAFESIESTPSPTRIFVAKHVPSLVVPDALSHPVVRLARMTDQRTRSNRGSDLKSQ